MEVILREDFPLLGYLGDRVVVKRGYARNYLVPQGIAVEVGSGRAKALNHTIAQIEAQRAKRLSAASDLAKRLSDLILEFTLKAGENGRTFGSVTAKDIEESLVEKGFDIDRRNIRMPGGSALKNLGEVEVDVKLHTEVLQQVRVRIRAEKVAVVAAESEDVAADGDAVEQPEE